MNEKLLSCKLNSMNTSNYQTFEEFIEYLEKPDSNYPWVAKDLPENANVIDRAKFDICQMIIDYKCQNKLTIEELTNKLKLDIDPTVESHREKLQKDIIQKILFCQTNNFIIDDLLEYAKQLSIPFTIEVKISEEPKEDTPKIYQGAWDETLNDQRILEIVQSRLNKKSFEPLPEPVELWNKEVYYLETTYRKIKYRIIFWFKGDGTLFVRNIWVVKDVKEKENYAKN